DNSSPLPPEEFISANSDAASKSFSPSPILVKDNGDTGILNIKMIGNISDQKAFMHTLMITLAPHQEKSPDLLSHRDCVCSKGNVEDKILVPKPPKNCARCARCGHPVDGPYCQGCALLRQELEENLVTHSQDFQDTSESSNDNTNVVNAPREPFVVEQDHGRDSEACQRSTCTRCGSGLSKGLCYICGNNQNSLNDSPSISENSSQSPPHINHCCYECGDPLYAIFCKRCTCKSCGKDAHIGYNCPPKVSIISNPEPCKNQTIDEIPQTLPSFHPTFHSEDESQFTCDSTPNYVDESPNVFNPPPQPLVYSCEFCGNDAHYDHYCTPQAPFIYPEPCYNQDFNFP
nr:hypothetical protein [Tanacetum cinerariifolium]